MDKLLRDYAKKRREEAGAPTEMHAATRKMLHAEIARTLGNREAAAPETRTAPRFVWWPKLAWSGAVAVALAMVLFSANHFLVKNKERPTTMAALKKETAELEKDSARSEPASVSAERPSGRSGSIGAPGVTVAPTPAPYAEAENEPVEKSSYASQARTRSDSDGVPSRAVQKSPAAPAAEVAAAMPAPAAKKAKDGEYLASTNSFDGYASVQDRLSHDVVVTQDLARATNYTVFTVAVTNSVNGLSVNRNEKEMRMSWGNNDPDRTGSFAFADAGSSSTFANNSESQSAFSGKVDARYLTQGIANYYSVAPASAVTGSFKQDSAKSEVPAPAKIAATQSAALGQNFRQQNLRANLRENLQSPPQPNVLSNFQILRNDSQLKIVDADGSVYEGAIDPQSAQQDKFQSDVRAKAGEEAKRRPTAPVVQPVGQAPNAIFRVVGVNRTLNQNIVFEGTMLNVSSGPALDYQAKTVGGKLNAIDTQVLADKKQDVPAAAPIQNIIRGLVDVGGTNQFKIEAIESP